MHPLLKMLQQIKQSICKIAIKSNILLILIPIFLNQFISHKIHTSSGFYVCNRGISFSFMLSWQNWLIWFVLLLTFLVYLLYNYRKNQINLLTFIYTALLFSGVISNLADRIFYGCVIDYLSIQITNLPFFNISDIEIFIGFLLFIFTNTTKK